MNAKLGNLPDHIEKECVINAQQGKNKCDVYFLDNDFFDLLGPANKSILKKINNPFMDEKINITEGEFYDQIIADLQIITGLKIGRYPFLDGTESIEERKVSPYRYNIGFALYIEW